MSHGFDIKLAEFYDAGLDRGRPCVLSNGSRFTRLGAAVEGPGAYDELSMEQNATFQTDRSFLKVLLKYRRQDKSDDSPSTPRATSPKTKATTKPTTEALETVKDDGGTRATVTKVGQGLQKQKLFGDKKNTRIRRSRATWTRLRPFRLWWNGHCDYEAWHCNEAYKTGDVCGRTSYYMYFDFANYCMLEYINCVERQDIWAVAHMGKCFLGPRPIDDYKHYPYEDDYFLDMYYLSDQLVNFLGKKK